MKNSFDSRGQLVVGKQQYEIARLEALEKQGYDISRLPFSLRILLENLLRREDGDSVTAEDIEALARWEPGAAPSTEIAFGPARVLLQDFTGVPAVVDLAAMREAMQRMGGDPRRINPLLPAELVIDHSVQVDAFGAPDALSRNVELEFQRNRERYTFLRWGQQAFDNFRVVPPGSGIIHQINVEYLARVVMTSDGVAYPDTLVGTDSHTTMVNGLGVLGWGVGGIEAEAAMLGQPVSMLVPQVVGFRLTGSLPEGATATDLVLTVVQMLRQKGVVGKFVEFFGPGLDSLPLADRVTLSNMSPEYGATCGIFPVDAATLDYLEFTGRSGESRALVEAYMKEQGLFRTPDSPDASYTDTVELDMSSVEPSLAGPSRPQDRLTLSEVGESFARLLETARGKPGDERLGSVTIDGRPAEVRDGAVVIAAITSCTNTSNPAVMMAAGLVAQKAVEQGLTIKPWVKPSLGPGSLVVTDYLLDAGLLGYLEELKFHVVGYGCTTCIGNSGPLPEPVARAIDQHGLITASVLSGNRNFEGRVHPRVRANYLASPPLVVAYALAGRVDIDLTKDPLGSGRDGQPVYLKDIWPSQQEVAHTIKRALRSEMFHKVYDNIFEGDESWRALEAPVGNTYAWAADSSYVKSPPFFDDMPPEPPDAEDIQGARVLGVFGVSLTTDHISPAGAIPVTGPAGRYLIEQGVEPEQFNSFGSRRGNHEVMMRGTFANIRLKNQLVPGVEGGETVHLPDGERLTMYEAAMRYKEEGVPLLVLAGREYGTGSSRDWAAKGTRLLGVRAVIVESFERIHRSNLIGMGVMPLEFKQGDTVESLGLDGREVYSVEGVAEAVNGPFQAGRKVRVTAQPDQGEPISFSALVRLDTPQEQLYYKHGGILQYVLRKLAT